MLLRPFSSVGGEKAHPPDATTLVRPAFTQDHEEIERKYTPTTSDLHKGYFDLVIKIYSGGVVMPQFPDGGKMSTFMGKLKVPPLCLPSLGLLLLGLFAPNRHFFLI